MIHYAFKIDKEALYLDYITLNKLTYTELILKIE